MAARAKELAEICTMVTCRMEPHELRLRAEGGSLVTTTDLLPYVHDGTVVLYPGESVTVDFAADGSMIDMPRFARLASAGDAVGMPSDARASVTLNFSQTDGKPDMLLVLKSSLGFAVKYDAYMYVPTPNGVESGYTSSCPLNAGLSATEHWPHAIMMIVLTNFRLATAADTACQ